MRFARFSDESGSAVLEFIGFGVMLQIPILMLATTLLGLQHDKLAAEAITRDALRSYTLLQLPPADNLVELASAYEIPTSRISLELRCWPQNCGTSENWVQVTTKIGSSIAQGLARQ